MRRTAFSFHFGSNITGLFQRRAVFLLLLLCNFQLNARSFAQTVTINKNRVTIDEIFRDIHRQTGYEFMYSSDILPAQRTVDIHVTNAPVTEVLNTCLQNLPVTYTIRDKVIMVRAAPSSPAQQPAPLVSAIKGKVIDDQGKPLGYATVQVVQTGLMLVTKTDGNFEIAVPQNTEELTLLVSYVGKASVTRVLNEKQFETFQLVVLRDLSLKMEQVEVNGVRKRTLASTSSVVFDREAIEQTQALSVGDVLKYLPGQSMVRPGASLQGASVLTLRNVAPPNTDQSLNNAFGISMQIDGSPVNNNANMQSMNLGLNGFISSHNIVTPNTLGNLDSKNGSFANTYTGDVANSGVDLRQLQAENIESIEVISGVASARYGDYNTGVVIINRQAGITPFRVSMRTNEGTQNVGVNKGFTVSPALGVLNLSFDYLNSNEDPRNKLKSYGRLGGGMLWTLHKKGAVQFKNTFSADYNTMLDKTRVDPDDGNERMSKFSNWDLRLSNRSELIVKKPWLYNISLQASYNRGRQESYSQYYLNLQPVIGVTESEVTGTFEGYYTPGYYLAVQQVIGEPVNAAARIETNSFFKINKLSYKLTLGSNYNYAANKGPGMIVFPDRPRFYQSGNKNDRARSFNEVPTQKNIGFYVENLFTTRLLNRFYTLNVGARGDVQNGFFNLSPRINSSWKLMNNLTWSLSYGIATKAPSLSQISPGTVYIDIPLINVYTGNADKSVYLAHTEVIPMYNGDLKPFKSKTFETGLSLDAKPFHGSVYFFDRLMDNGFTTLNQLLPVVLPNYTVTTVSGEKPQYAPDGTYKTYNVGYNKINNGNYNRTRGFEFIASTDKIRSIATSFNLSLAYYASHYLEKNDEVSVPQDGANIDYTKPAVYGVYSNQESKAKNIKTTFTSSTHIPALRLALMLTGEVYWVNRTENLATSMYPSGYLNKDLVYFPLDAKEAASDEYAHLRRSAKLENVRYLPSFVYPNIHLRLSKEIGDYLRFSFNAYNAFNIRPTETNYSTLFYYNGRPSFGAELLFTIK
jgi:ferric enterobactin receptor